MIYGSVLIIDLAILFFLLHLALVLSLQFLSRFALTSHANTHFLIYAQFYSV